MYETRNMIFEKKVANIKNITIIICEYCKCSVYKCLFKSIIGEFNHGKEDCKEEVSEEIQEGKEKSKT